MKILTVVGARPQFIKASMLNRLVRSNCDVSEVIVHTGQHHDALMSDVFFQQLDISQPSHFLGVSGGTHGDMTGRMMIALDEVLLTESPDVVLVYGDTNSTLAAALCSAKIGIPIAHVEAGLRSFNRMMPEEVNRVLTDHLAKFLFCPTEVAIQNLASEGITEIVENVGDIMYDAALHYGNKAKNVELLTPNLRGLFDSKNYILATIHRQENTDDPIRLQRITSGLLELADSYPIVIPLHPRTRNRLGSELLQLLNSHPNIQCTEPLGYLEILQMERNAGLIVTDSGGMQKEAFFFKVPCVTLRDQTEWTELIDSGWNTLVDVSRDRIADVALSRYGSNGEPDISPYGDGNTASAILACLKRC